MKEKLEFISEFGVDFSTMVLLSLFIFCSSSFHFFFLSHFPVLFLFLVCLSFVTHMASHEHTKGCTYSFSYVQKSEIALKRYSFGVV